MRLIYSSLLLLLFSCFNYSQAQTFESDIVRDVYNSSETDLKALKSITLRPKPDGTPFIVPYGSTFRASIYPPDQYLPTSESNMNFIKTEQMLTTSGIGTNNVKEKIVTYQYFDGLGRPIQSVDVKGSPTYNDVVLHQAYDAFGRENKKFLTYTAFPGDGLYKTGAAADQLSFYNTSTGTYNNTVKTDASPFATAEFEASPLNRVLQQGAPGTQWQPGNKAVQFGYLVNKHGTSVQGEESLPIWSISAVTVSSATEYIIGSTANYGTGSLYINATTDENGKQVREYVDKQGKTIVKKVQYIEGTPNTYDDSHWAITYYIYDDFDRLRFVLQPEFWVSKATYAGYSDNEDKRTFLGKLTFEYRYDGRGRMIYKKVPGAEPVEMAYDQWDRLVLSRDGKQKEDGKWFFTKYDALNRPILTGEISNSSSWTTHQTELNTFAVRFETRVSEGVGYTTSQAYPTSVGLNDIYTITYYDEYTFKSSLGSGTAYDYAGPYSISVKGLVVGTKERVLNSSPLQWLVSVNYYDDRYRLVHNVADDHLGNKNKTTNTYYGITNWLTTSTLVHGTSKLTSVTTTEYDHRGRVLNVVQTMDNTPAVMLVANKYNEIGELVEKNQHSTDGGKTFLQSVDHRYNIRGWLTHINNRELSNDGTLNNDANDLFGMELGYNTGVTIGSDNIAAQYNGNISSMAWKTNNLVDASEEKIYGFKYDPLNRLKDAKYAKRNGSYWNADVSMFNEDNISYDRNGNISHLDRRAKMSGASAYMDQLGYTYAGLGNQLTTVDDASLYDNPQAAGGDFGFTENTAGVTEYAYDKNGNMKSDLNKGIVNITYNHLNLPSLVELESKEGKTRTIAYTYSASGAKLKKLAKWGTETIGETDYVGGIHYEKSQLAFVQMGEGRALKNGTKWEYEYHLKDHLGNARVVYGLLQDVDASLTTAESELISQEQSKFSNMGSQQRSTLFNHTQPDNLVITPNESFELNGNLNKPIGPTKMLQVKSGERVTMEVFARSPVTVSSNSVISSLASALTGAFGLGAATEGYAAISNQAPVTAGLIGRNSNVPKAYLCYILFNNSYGFVQQGFHAVSSASVANFEKLAMDIPVPVDGYMYIYIANESNVSSAASTYFDDFNVVHYRNSSTLKVNQVQDYYPFGATFNSYSRESSAPQNFLYQEKEWQQDLSLNLYDFEWRQYDPFTIRTTTMDPHADSYPLLSPYSWAANNPLSIIDPDGQDIINTSFATTYTEDDAQNMFRQHQSQQSTRYQNQGNDDYSAPSFSVGFSSYRNQQRNACNCPNPFETNWYDFLNKKTELSDALYEINKFNPIAILGNSISTYINGYDTYGTPQTTSDAALNLAMAMPWFRVAGSGSILLSKGLGSIWSGGKTFVQYKAAHGGTQTLAKIATSTGTQRISTEFSHMFITQRMQRAYNLPNWLVNNRLNVWKLNTIQHSLVDSYRYRFLRVGIKSEVGWFGKYNWFTKF